MTGKTKYGHDCGSHWAPGVEIVSNPGCQTQICFKSDSIFSRLESDLGLKAVRLKSVSNLIQYWLRFETDLSLKAVRLKSDPNQSDLSQEIFCNFSSQDFESDLSQNWIQPPNGFTGVHLCTTVRFALYEDTRLFRPTSFARFRFRQFCRSIYSLVISPFPNNLVHLPDFVNRIADSPFYYRSVQRGAVHTKNRGGPSHEFLKNTALQLELNQVKF